MKKLNKLAKILLAIIINATIIISSISSVSAVSETITLGDPPKTKGYIAGVTFHYKTTTGGKDLYCLNIHKNTARNITATLVKNSKTIDGGLTYILKNGYPEKSITGDKDKDYYITQTAVWWYLDETTGSTNLGNAFKSTGSDPHNMRHHVKALVDAGIAHRNDSTEISDPKLIINTTGSNDLTLKGEYYESSSIKATTAKNVSSYYVTLSGAPSGTKVVKGTGEVATYKNGFRLKTNETFKIKVPAQAMKTTELSIKVTAKATGETQYKAYEYKPVDSSMQNVALLEKTKKDVASELTLTAESTKVKVIKIDANTKQPLAGAKFVLKDINGNVITSWTSTTNAHVIRNLTNGKYTIEETAAPTGYLKNTNVTTFEITDDNKDITIKVENTPKKVVVNITKVDQETNQPLAGAVLVVKDATGKEVARFTTTESSYVLTDLENGTYTVEEESAPAGYIRSNEKVTFTIDDNNLSHQIIFVNAKEVIVPNTASAASIIMFILGIGITGFGIRFIYKNGKRA